MGIKTFMTVFVAIFIAELGDKTQLATLLFAADPTANKWVVFSAAALALILASAVAVAAGGVLSKYAPERYLRIAAGIGFIGIGIWMLLRGQAL